MRKIMLKAILLAMLVGGASNADAQNVVTCETVVVENDEGEKITTTTTTNSQTTAKARNRGEFNFLGSERVGMFEVGVNMLPSPDYTGYEGYGTFLDLRTAASLQWTFSLVGMAFDFDKRGIFTISAGAQLTWNNYVLANSVTLVKDNGRLVPKDLQNPKKSKLTNFGVKIPVLLSVNLPSKFFLAAGAYGGANIGTKAKYKFPRTKVRDAYMNPFYYGVTGRIGYAGFYIYADYGLSELFQKDKGPEVAPLTIGIGFGF